MDPSHLEHLQYQFSSETANFEAFPHAEQLFHDAFALPDPAPELLKLIQAHPTYMAVANLMVYYIAAAHENPSRANALALAMVAVCDSPDAPVIGGDTVGDLIAMELHDLHSRSFDFTTDPLCWNNNFGIVPANTFLLASLLSGLSIKYNLADSPDQYGTLWVEGINNYINSSMSEMLFIGACIQLLTSGSIIIPRSEAYIQSADDAVTKLKAQKSRGIVKDSNALRLVELTISHAETGCEGKHDVDNVWELLFPSESQT